MQTIFCQFRPFATNVFILASFFIYQSFNAQVTDGLVAKFSFNSGKLKNEAGPTSAKGYNIDFVEDRFGNENHACYIQGNHDSYINLGTEDYLKPERGSISVWVNMHGIMGRGSGVESAPIIYTRAHLEENCNDAYYIGMDLNTKKLNGAVSLSPEAGATLYSKQSIGMVKWYHVVMTYDDDFLCLYVDGQVQYKAAKKFRTKFLEGDSVLVGIRANGKNVRFLLGCVDDIFIYNRVLSPDEVADLYHASDPNRWRPVLKYATVLVTLGCFLLIVTFYIKRRIRKGIEKEREKNELRYQVHEFEIRMLKAQMNPHFVFNSLNTIQQFIIINENENALLYLSKFSKLMRKLFESNTHDRISLQDELTLLNGYIEIESLRFNNVFKYDIIVDDKMDKEKTFIPHFLIQPFVENAIWHGLLRKKGDKELSVKFNLENSTTILCTIDDNGIGREKASKEKPLGKKSVAIEFIKQRLQTINKMRKLDLNLMIVDKFSDAGLCEGTTIKITIPILNGDAKNSNN